MILTLIRHGETEGNRRKLYYGATDLPLLPQAWQTLHENAASYPAAAHYYTSGLLRTEQTLEAIYGAVAHAALPGLREIDFGTFEMQSYDMLKDRPDYQAWLTDVEHNRCPGGESAAIVLKRSLAALAPLLSLPEDCVCVTHGGVIAGLMMYWFGGTRYDYSPSPGGGYRIFVSDGKPLTWQRL